MRAISIAVGVFVLTGCSASEAPQAEERPSAEMALERNWKALPDGSKAYVSIRKGQHSGAIDVERCWPKGQRWDCLGAFQLTGGTEIDDTGAPEVPVEMTFRSEMDGPSLNVARAFKNRLDEPFPHSDEDNPRGGYRCYTMGRGTISEVIFQGEGEGVTLLSNDTMPSRSFGGQPWTPEYVQDFMSENSISPDRPYWNCYAIERLVANGSLATLATTALTYESMIGSAR